MKEFSKQELKKIAELMKKKYPVKFQLYEETERICKAWNEAMQKKYGKESKTNA